MLLNSTDSVSETSLRMLHFKDFRVENVIIYPMTIFLNKITYQVHNFACDEFQTSLCDHSRWLSSKLAYSDMYLAIPTSLLSFIIDFLVILLVHGVYRRQSQLLGNPSFWTISSKYIMMPKYVKLLTMIILFSDGTSQVLSFQTTARYCLRTEPQLLVPILKIFS